MPFAQPCAVPRGMLARPFPMPVKFTLKSTSLFEISFVFVRFFHVASDIVNTNHGIM
jgi:hypothetical protein